MQKLVDGLHKFQSGYFQSHKDLFRTLCKGQNPEALFITCSDSRINPNLLTQTGPGDLFIMRNAGNIVPRYEDAAGSSEAGTIEFAVAGLGVQHVVVCGHTLCGAMRGLVEPSKLEGTPMLKRWLNHAESARQFVAENYRNLEGDAKVTVMAEENVLTQIENLQTHPTVKDRLEKGELRIYGWVYKIETGEVFQYEPERNQFELISDPSGIAPVPAKFRERASI
ncbi:carbonic anhydrase [Chondromyces crocatus]|uniref:Carbonic anhydrase n=1 Tax=Chondromyces crocatus TaxID=52 RepID=A0A0K1E606_CHOCO|nr:carbonic anhydrase [Chondromyces crocatus]AKT36316.1 carbonic anhydrase [Chondromyces crocatus]